MNYSLICHDKKTQMYQPEADIALQPGFLQIEIEKAAICGSDYMVLNGTHPYKQYPAILGHEFIGKVVKTSSDVPFNKGQWVTGLSYGACEQCAACQNGLGNHCENKVTYNTAGSSGAFTRNMIAHYSSLLPLPEQENIPEEYVLSEPLSIIVHAMRKVDFSNANKIAIIGAGAMGLLSAIYCCEEKGVPSITITDNLAARQQFTQSLGYSAVKNLCQEAKNSIDILIVAGGSELDLDEYLRYLAPAAQIVLISYFDTRSSVDMNTLVRKEITLHGSFLSDKDDLQDAIDIIQRTAKTSSNLKKIISQAIHFSDLRDFMLNQSSVGKVVVNQPGVLL